MIFTLQNITFAKMSQQNNDFTQKDVIKKLLSHRVKKTEFKFKESTQGGQKKYLRVFDTNSEPFVNLEEVDFREAFKFLMKNFTKPCNWL